LDSAPIKTCDKPDEFVTPICLLYDHVYFGRQISLDKCRKLAKLAERLSVRVTNEVQVTIFGDAAFLKRFSDFGVLWLPPFVTATCAASFTNTGVIYIYKIQVI